MTTSGSPSRWLWSASDVAWRSLVLAVAVLAAGALLWKLRTVLLPVLVALLVCSALAPAVTRLEARGWRPLLATGTVMLAALIVVAGLLTVVIAPTVDEADAIVDAVSSGLADIEDWLVEGPLDVDRERIREITSDPVQRLADVIGSSSGQVVRGVRTAGEILAGTVLALILTLLFLKDGRRFQHWVLAHLPARHHDLTRAAATRAWGALSGYLRGAALLGVVEGVIIGTTLRLVGSPLYGPVAVLTFLAAFFPVVGAIIAGAVAVLVTLASAGAVEALIVLAVAVAVQQLDNDLLAPVIYGQSLQLHPAVILVVLTAGGVLGGIVGAFLAVPLTGAVFGVTSEIWDRHGRPWAEADAGGTDPSDQKTG